MQEINWDEFEALYGVAFPINYKKIICKGKQFCVFSQKEWEKLKNIKPEEVKVAYFASLENGKGREIKGPFSSPPHDLLKSEYDFILTRYFLASQLPKKFKPLNYGRYTINSQKEILECLIEDWGYTDLIHPSYKTGKKPSQLRVFLSDSLIEVTPIMEELKVGILQKDKGDLQEVLNKIKVNENDIKRM